MAKIKTPPIPPILRKEIFLKLVKRSKELKREEELIKESEEAVKQELSDQSESAESTAMDVQRNISQARLGLIQNARIEIRRALAKMRIGTYGVCEVCKKPIDLARLKAYPEATKCFECAKKIESKESE